MIYKLFEAAGGMWRRINGSHLDPLARARAVFVDGELQSFCETRILREKRKRKAVYERKVYNQNLYGFAEGKN